MPQLSIDHSNVHNFREILEAYNKISELCFSKCVSNLNSSKLTNNEEKCVNDCSSKFVASNKILLSKFVDLQAKKQQDMMKEQEKLQQQQDGNNAQQLPQLQQLFQQSPKQQ